MTNNSAVSRPGAGALAYPVPNLTDPISPCQCTLEFKCDSRSATILLRVQVNTETFVLQYNADNLVSGHIRLTNGANPALDQHVGEILGNHGRPRIMTLELALQQSGPLWCLMGEHSVREYGLGSLLGKLVDLVKAKKVHVVFDFNAVPRQHQSTFKAFAKAAKHLSGYPVDAALTQAGFKKASWTDFSPIDSVGAPPAYLNPRKRPRQATPSPPKQSRRRSALLSPPAPQTSDETVPNSPATADIISEAYLHAEALKNILSSLHPAIQPDPVAVVAESERGKLRDPSPSPVEQSPLILLKHVILKVKEDLSKIQQQQIHLLERLRELEEKLEAAEDKHDEATVEFEDCLEDQRFDMRVAKDETLEELTAEGDELLAKWKQDALDLVDEVDDVFMIAFEKMCDRVNNALTRFKFKGSKASGMRRRQRRAVSRDVKKGRSTLLGKRRDSEWEDC